MRTNERTNQFSRIFSLGLTLALLVAFAASPSYAALILQVDDESNSFTIADGSAAITGILLALNLPPSSPWWLTLLGSVIAIAIGKQVYGGLGSNPFNPALVAANYQVLGVLWWFRSGQMARTPAVFDRVVRSRLGDTSPMPPRKYQRRRDLRRPQVLRPAY